MQRLNLDILIIFGQLLTNLDSMKKSTIPSLGSITIQKLNVACQDVPLPKGFDMENRSKPWICSVYYHSKWCMEIEKRKNNITRKKWGVRI